jgi:hypothetical protein
VCWRVRDAPAALRRLGEQHPRPLRERRVAGGAGDDLGQLPYDAELLVAVQDARRREDLHAHVFGAPGHGRDRLRREVVDEGRGVVGEQRDLRDLLPAHHRAGEILREAVLVAERPSGGVDVDHRHASEH